MRRKDREITDLNEIVKIMNKCDTCRIALNDEDGYPYIVPLNFGMEFEGDQMYLYFHGARLGKKLDLIRRDPRAAFEMDCSHNILMYEELMSCTMGYESVMGNGTIEFVEEEKKLDALKIIMRHFHSEDFAFSTKIMPATIAFRLKVNNLSAKRRDNIKPDQKKVHHLSLENSSEQNG